MTKQELSQLLYLKKEIAYEHERLLQLRAAATDTSVNITGLPRGGGMADKTAIAAMIADAEAVIAARRERCVAEYGRLNAFIASVGDSLTRQLLTLRYVEGMSWVQIALRVGGGNTADGLRMMHNRFFAKKRT